MDNYLAHYGVRGMKWDHHIYSEDEQKESGGSGSSNPPLDVKRYKQEKQKLVQKAEKIRKSRQVLQSKKDLFGDLFDSTGQMSKKIESMQNDLIAMEQQVYSQIEQLDAEFEEQQNFLEKAKLLDDLKAPKTNRVAKHGGIAIMTYEEHYLSHYGIKGQKWGVRRFQNDDGTLTKEGKLRYRGQEKSEDKGFMKKVIGGEDGMYAYSKHVQRKRDKQIARAEKKLDNATTDKKKEKVQQKLEKLEKKREAQAAANANLAAYRSHSTTDKLMAQDLFMPTLGLSAHRYRVARARGADHIGALVESTPFYGTIRQWQENKKAYGKSIVHSDNEGEIVNGED